MEKIIKFIRRYSFVIILFLSIPAVRALFVPGYFGASDDLHIAWLYEMDRSLSMGQFPPRFVPDLSFGFGYPLFNFVFPLPFYMGEVFHKLGLSLVNSIKAVFVLSIPVSMYFMYKFLREHTNEILGLAGAILYVYTPYRATDIYVRGAIGEIWAFVFPPLIAYAISKISETKEKKWIAVLGIGTAGLVLSHNIMAYMFAPFLALLAIFLRKNIFRTLCGFGLGLFISVYFWLPAITESRLLKYSTVFNFVDHFPTLKQLFTPYFGYGASVPGPGDGMSFFIGLINIILIVISLVLIRKVKPIIYWSLGAVFVSIFLMNFRSSLIWSNFPFLPYFQFPWRFLSLVAFASSVLVVALDKLKSGKYIGLVIIAGAIVLNSVYFRPQDHLNRDDAYYINRYIPVPVASEEYLKTGEEYLRLPLATQTRSKETSPDIGLKAKFNLDAGGDSVFHYYKYNFPGWEAKIDGKVTQITPGKPFGQITFDMPKGKHTVEVVFKETPFRKILNFISFGSFILALILLL